MNYWLLYGSSCIAYSGYLMIRIYEPVISELRYAVSERYGSKYIGSCARLGNFYAFVGFILAAIFAPYIFYVILKYGHYPVMKSYKHTLWLGVRADIEERIANEK